MPVRQYEKLPKPQAKNDGLLVVIYNSALSSLNNSTTTYWPSSLFEFDDPVLCELFDVLTLPRESKIVNGVAQRPGCSASHVPDEVSLSHAPRGPGPLAVIRDPPGELGFGGADDAAGDQFKNISDR
ncbi:hypothetical protein GE21DRAFT_1311135 [Neurospora crassa]|nr:hypothetical protein GE21DRAFT_1311135 [Neurospora crassa]